MHCEWHAKSAVGRAAKRELKELVRQLEALQSETDPTLRRRAEGRLRSRLESGAYATLFSPELKAQQEEMRKNTELGAELASVRLALYRTLLEVEDPAEMARVIVQLSGESRRVVEGRRSG